ncbi:MAG: hypothetical protein JWR10_533 [Rubritepida sp.]|nr:hypothetical protein [Rubritepida sp.]
MKTSFRPVLLASALLIGFGAPVFATESSSHGTTPAAAASTTHHATTTRAVVATRVAPSAPAGHVTATRSAAPLANGSAQVSVRPAVPTGTVAVTPAPSTTRVN